MDKFSYAIGLGIGQNLLGMGAKGIAVDDFAQAIKDVLEGNQTAISHQEAREIVNKYFEELETKMNAANIEQGKAFLEENKKRPNVVTLPSVQKKTRSFLNLNTLVKLVKESRSILTVGKR